MVPMGESGGHPLTLPPDDPALVSLIIPCFNEADTLPHLIDVLSNLDETRWGDRFEFVLVDDGSTDGTADLVEREAAGWSALRVLRHRVNEGKTNALLTAANETDRTWIILFDADLQHLPDEIPRFLAKLQDGWDIVTGRKVGAYDKRAISSIYNRLSRRIFRVPVSDLNSMKAFRREVLEELHLRRDWHRFFVVLAHARGWSVTEIDISLYPRRAGVSKYRGPLRILIGLLDLMSVWFLVVFSRKPLLFFGVPQPPVKRTSERLTVSGAFADYVTLLKRPEVAWAAVAYFVMFFGVAVFVIYLPTWLERDLGASGDQIALMFLVGGIANVVTGPQAGKLSDRIGRKGIILLSCIGLSVLMLGTVPLVTNITIAYVFFFLTMVLVAMRVSPFSALLTGLVRDERRGSLMSLAVALGQLGFALGGAVSGPMFARVGYASNTVLGAVFVLGMGLVVWFFIPEPNLEAAPATAD